MKSYTPRNILLLCLFLLAAINPLRAQVTLSDSFALVSIYNETFGPNWFDNSGWLSSPVSNWYGVSITGDRVSALDLNSNNLAGYVPTRLTELDSLLSLNLFNNVGIDSIQSLRDLPALRYLNLSKCGLSEIPDFIQSTKLDTAILGSNLLLETPSFQGLEDLVYLDLSANDLKDIKPFNDLSSLRELRIDNNELDYIPSVSALLSLDLLYLHRNNLKNLPDLSALGNLTDLRVYDNELDELGDFSALTNLDILQVQSNKLDFIDLETLATEISLSGLTTWLYSPQDSIGANEDCLEPSVPITLSIAPNGGASLYEWERDGTSLGPPQPLNFEFFLDPTGSPSPDPGIYTCYITNPAFPDLTLAHRAYEIETFPATFIPITAGSGADTLESGLPLSFIGTTFILESDLIIQGSTTVNITDCIFWVCNPNASIIVQETSLLNVSGSVFKPCKGDETWEGFEVIGSADLDMDDCTIFNAEIGVDVSSFALTEVKNSTFRNCNTGVKLAGPSAFGSTAVDEVIGNTFSLDDRVPDYFDDFGIPDEDYVGVYVFDRNLGTFGFSAGVVENVFLNLNGLACIDYCGIIAEEAGIVIEGNKYLDMYCGVDIKNPQAANVVMGDSVVNLNVAECTSIAHLIEDAVNPVKITGSVFQTFPGPYDSIFIAVAALNCTNFLEVDNNDMINFDHGIVMDNNFKAGVFDNYIDGGYVGTYFRNSRQVDFFCNDFDDILCGTGYRIDNSNLLFVEANFPAWFGSRVSFTGNRISAPPVNNNNVDPDHDDEYSMRFFGCPSDNPTVACGIAEGIEVMVSSPDVADNEMDSLRVEFTASAPPAPFGTPPMTCMPGAPRIGYLSPREWTAYVNQEHELGTGDFKLDILRAMEFESASKDELSCTPNPVGSAFQLSQKGAGSSGVLSVYDLQGRLQWQEYSSGSHIQVPQQMQEGLYLLSWETETQIMQGKCLFLGSSR
jgi:hypothetical protein